MTFIFFPLFFAEFDNDDRYAVAHNINDYDEDENDEDDDEFTTKDYSKKQNERNYYSSTNRNNQRPASNKNHHQKSNSVSEKSTSLWSNSGKFFSKEIFNAQCGNLRIFLSLRFYVKSIFENFEG